MAKNNRTADRVQAALNFIGGDDILDALMSGRAKLEIKFIQRLNQQGAITILATTEKFVAKEKFYKNSKEIKFYGICENFYNWFLADDGKIEESLSEQELHYGNLTKNSVDYQIIAEIGGEAKAETTLTELYELLKKQCNGEEGDLLTNSYANIFYIRDTSGVLRTVVVIWGVDGWFILALSVVRRFDWRVGFRVFSRNS